jgi:CBS domain containing-hemolysin-like protein
MAELGRLPVVGDEVLIDEGALEVQRLDGRRIDRVRFVPTPAPEAETAETERGER